MAKGYIIYTFQSCLAFADFYVSQNSSFEKKRRLGNRTEERSVKKVRRDTRLNRDRGKEDRDDRYRRSERTRREDHSRQNETSHKNRQSAEIRPKIGSVVRPIASSFVQSVQPEIRNIKKEDIPEHVEEERDSDRNGGVPSVVRITPR